MKWLPALVVLWACLMARHGAASNESSGELELTILHTNDIHSHIEESSKYGGLCSEKDKNLSACVGGVARITSKVKELKEKYPGALFMNAGDFYQGTAWYSILKDKIVSAVMAKMGYDYICLGNHEFDDGPKGLAPFLEAMKAANVTVVNTNANFSNEAALRDIALPKSVTFTINDTKIGVVGAVLHETKVLSNPGNVTFRNDLDSIQEEAKKLDRKWYKNYRRHYSRWISSRIGNCVTGERSRYCRWRSHEHVFVPRRGLPRREQT
ncbi:hypothetical protein V5799_021669 [Amblyomma americanum]|uniref:5'-nucleotidase n=1 Tax=Amblyomma americanum TaxID=6943 RepID=A0AAQ4FPY6_AMBAM